MQLTLSQPCDAKECKDCRIGEYRDCSELNYYGSDLNKLIDKECSREMTCNNIDCLMYKRSKKTLRIIESKHSNENMPAAQKELLRIIAKLFKILNSVQSEYLCEVYVVVGDYPYEEARIENLITGRVDLVGKAELKDFLEFK